MYNCTSCIEKKTQMFVIWLKIKMWSYPVWIHKSVSNLTLATQRTFITGLGHSLDQSPNVREFQIFVWLVSWDVEIYRNNLGKKICFTCRDLYRPQIFPSVHNLCSCFTIYSTSKNFPHSKCRKIWQQNTYNRRIMSCKWKFYWFIQWTCNQIKNKGIWVKMCFYGILSHL